MAEHRGVWTPERTLAHVGRLAVRPSGHDPRPVSSACLLAVVYDDAATAGRALAALSGLADEHALALKDAAVVVRDADGVELHQEHSLAQGEGVVGGGMNLFVGGAIESRGSIVHTVDEAVEALTRL